MIDFMIGLIIAMSYVICYLYYISVYHEVILLGFDCILVLLCCYFDIGITMYNIPW